MDQDITLHNDLSDRGSSEVTVPFSRFNTLSSLKKFARDEFEYENECTITNFDRDPITEEIFSSMLDGGFWRGNQNRQDFLAVDAVNSELKREISAELNFPPHWSLVKIAHSHFDRIDDAVAELIDNSIQATNGNSRERKIEVEVRFLRNEGGGNYMVVRDNGRGMDKKGLEAFATYHLSQKDRGIVHPANDGDTSSPGGTGISSGHISKFGVGAIEAGFYIGTRIQVVTKIFNNPDVREFTLDQRILEQRQHDGEQVYSSRISLRAAGGEVKDSADPAKKLLDQLRGQEIGMKQFTYIVLSLRDQHSEVFREERGVTKLARTLASMYHYYLHPHHRPVRSARQHGGGAGASASGVNEMPITIMLKKTTKATERRFDLADVPSLEKSLNVDKRDSFLFELEVPHPSKKKVLLPATGVIHYYPHNGIKETRPRVQDNGDDREEPTIEVFWETRLVPKSLATAMSFFPSRRVMKKLEKETRDQLNFDWSNRIMGMLFVSWNFPISNNKLNLQFRNGYNLSTTLLSRDKDSMVLYAGRENMEKKFAEWLIRCHKEHDMEHTFYSNIRGSTDKYAQMKKGQKIEVFAKVQGSAGTQVKLKTKYKDKVPACGKIIFFRQQEDEDGHKKKTFKFLRYPLEVFGDTSKNEDKDILDINEFDQVATTNVWNRALAAARKLLPATIKLNFQDGQPPPLDSHFSVRIGKSEESTAVNVEILNGNDEVITKTPSGIDLHVHSNLTYEDDKGTDVTALKNKTPLVQVNPNQHHQYGFKSMKVHEVRRYKWTIWVTPAYGPALNMPKPEVLSLTGKPGDPAKCVVEVVSSEVLPLTRDCWVPPFTVKLLDDNGCSCPLKAFKSVTLTCAETGTFEIKRSGGTGSSTDRPPWEQRDATARSLNYGKRSWELVPRKKGILSDTGYKRRSISFVVEVEAASTHRGKPTENGTFSITFEPGEPKELVLLSPDPNGDGTLLRVASGSSLPPLTYGIKDNWGNRTAPSERAEWEVGLEVSAASDRQGRVAGQDEEDMPRFSKPMQATVAAAKAQFRNPIVEWKRILPQEGKKVKIVATLRDRKHNRKHNVPPVSTTSMVNIMPTEGPFGLKIIQNGSTWKDLKSFTAGSEISRLSLCLLNQCNHAVKDKSTYESVTCSWSSGWKWTGNSGSSHECALPSLEVPLRVCARSECTVTVKISAVDGRAEKYLSKTVEYAVVAGKLSRWVAVGRHREIVDDPGPVEMTAGCTSNNCLASFASVIAGFRPVDRFENEVAASKVTDIPNISVEKGTTSMDTKLVQNSRGPMKLKKPIGIGPYKFPEGFNISGKPGQVYLLLTSDREGSRGSNGHLRLQVNMTSGPPVRMKIRSEGLLQEEFVDEMTVEEQAGFEIFDLEVKLEDAFGNEALLPDGGIKVTVTDSGQPEILRAEYDISTPREMLVLTLPQKEDRDNASFFLRAAGVGRVEQACINWHRTPSNAVTAVRMEAVPPQAPNSPEGNAGGSYENGEVVQRQVDAPLPTLVVWVETDDRKGFEPPKDSIAITLTEERSEILIRDQYNSPVLSTRHGTAQALEFTPQSNADNGMDLSIGTYEIRCTYVESRPGQPKREEFTEMTMHVVAGAPHRLEPHHDANIPDSLSASNLENRRKLLPQLEIVVRDLKNNVVRSGVTGPVCMHVKNTGDVPSGMPRLANSENNGGYILAERTATNTFIFPATSLQAAQAGVRQAGGPYKLEINSMGEGDHLIPWTKDFLFTSEQEELQLIQEAQTALEPYEKEYARYRKDHANARARVKEASQCAEEAITNLPSWDLRGAFNTENLATSQASIATAMRKRTDLQERNDEARQAYNSRPRRATLETENKLTRMAEQRIGDIYYVANLGFAESEHDAKLLSQAAGGKMKAIYVMKKAQLALARGANACAFCKETIIPFEVKRAGLSPRRRNDDEKADGKLPLELPSIPEEGFRFYLVNRIKLPKHDEDLRDTLFWAMYGTMVVFDTYANAGNSQYFSKHDILIEEDGSVLGKDGYMDVSNVGKQPTIVFDAMPVVYTEAYVRRATEINGLDKVETALRKLKDDFSNQERVETIRPSQHWMEKYDKLKNTYEERKKELTRREGGNTKRQRLN